MASGRVIYRGAPNNGDELSIFLPPYKQVSTRIRLSAQILNVAVDQRTGIFAVTLYDGSAGEVQFFRHGYQGPCNTVVASGFGVLGTGSAFDHEGRLFIEDAENNGYETVASITGECKATTVEVYQFPFADIKPQYPFTFTAQDNLVFQDGYTQNILTFAHPLNGRFANPLVTTTLTPTGPKPMGLECLIGDGKHLWAAELPPGSTPQLTEYRYPQGGAPIATISLVHPYTCAAFPPIIP